MNFEDTLIFKIEELEAELKKYKTRKLTRKERKALKNNNPWNGEMTL